MKCAAVILAGGSGLRAQQGKSGTPKQYRCLAGRSVIARVLDIFLSHPRIELVQVVLRAGTGAVYAAAVSPHPRLLAPIEGGHRRQDSARLGLEALAAAAPGLVLIHDAARPFASAALIDRVLAALKLHRAAVPGLAIPDTLKRVTAGGLIEATVERNGMRAVQTPQGFRFSDILAAYRNAARTDLAFTDDAAVAEWNGLAVALVDGEPANRKLTTAEDLIVAEAQLARTETRIGTGFDVHRLGPGDQVLLCGIAIPFDRGLIAHSDADVGLHALTDALLGAIGEGDIGSHFPPSDPQWQHAASAQFLAHAANLIEARGGKVVNVDITLICEAPKVGPFRAAMRARIGAILGIDSGRVAVKATTSEGLGFAGRGEGIAAHAVASVTLPIRENDHEIA